MVSVSDPHPHVDSPSGMHRAGRSGPPDTPIPLFCKAVFVVDLVFCLLRLPLAGLSLLGFHMIRQGDPQSPLLDTVWLELLCHGGIFLCGTVGYPLLLARRAWGMHVIGVLLVFVLAAAVLVLWQATLTMNGVEQDPAYRVGMWLGIAFRCGIGLLVVGALVNYRVWYRSTPTQALAHTFD